MIATEMTTAQCRYLESLSRDLNWDPSSLHTAAQKYFEVPDYLDLDKQQASYLIEELIAMKEEVKLPE